MSNGVLINTLGQVRRRIIFNGEHKVREFGKQHSEAFVDRNSRISEMLLGVFLLHFCQKFLIARIRNTQSCNPSAIHGNIHTVAATLPASSIMASKQRSRFMVALFQAKF